MPETAVDEGLYPVVGSFGDTPGFTGIQKTTLKVNPRSDWLSKRGYLAILLTWVASKNCSYRENKNATRARKNGKWTNLQKTSVCQISNPSIVEEVMKRITKLPFLFYTHPESYYEIPQDSIKFRVYPVYPQTKSCSAPSTRDSKVTRLQGKVAGSCARVNPIQRSINSPRCSSDFMNQSHLQT